MATGTNFELTKLKKIQIGGAVVMVVGSMLAVAQAMQPKSQTPLCEQRYTGGILFSLSHSGAAPLAPEDIQARLGGLDWGLTTNTRVIKDAEITGGFALEIDIKRAPGAEVEEQNRGGVGFTWMPQKLESAKAACLSYSFWMPADFKTGDGGTLPGLVNNTQPDGGDESDNNRDAKEGEKRLKAKPFSLRPGWRPDGRIVLNAIVNSGQPSVVMLDPQKARLKPGRWTRIEQEVVLNTPGRNNGVLRVWIDRQLVLERFDVGYRNADVQNIEGVSGNTHFTRAATWAQPPSDTKMRLSPLELRLQ